LGTELSPTQDYASKAVGDYNREISLGVTNGAKIDVIMYRFSDQRHGDPMIKAVAAGIPVRLIDEQENYRDPGTSGTPTTWIGCGPMELRSRIMSTRKPALRTRNR
jgi:hypothetical protein